MNALAEPQLMSLQDLCRQIINGGVIGADEVVALRRAYYRDGKVDTSEAEQLFVLNDAPCKHSPHWKVFFVEALMDFVVFQTRPTGYVTDQTAQWLISKIIQDGRLKSESELKLLCRIFERAVHLPEMLVAFTLNQIKHVILTGDSRVIGGDHVPGRVDASEVEVLRHILFAGAGSGNNAVSRVEAEILFDIEETTADTDNDPTWADLFAKAIGNCVLAASNYTPPPREVALAQVQWLEEHGDGGMFGKVMNSVASGDFLKQAVGNFGSIESESQRRRAQKNDALDKANREAENLDAEEVKWITDRLLRDGRVTATEKALLDFLRKEASHLHPAFAQILAQAS